VVAVYAAMNAWRDPAPLSGASTEAVAEMFEEMFATRSPHSTNSVTRS